MKIRYSVKHYKKRQRNKILKRVRYILIHCGLEEDSNFYNKNFLSFVAYSKLDDLLADAKKRLKESYRRIIEAFVKPVYTCLDYNAVARKLIPEEVSSYQMTTIEPCLHCKHSTWSLYDDKPQYFCGPQVYYQCKCNDWRYYAPMQRL